MHIHKNVTGKPSIFAYIRILHFPQITVEYILIVALHELDQLATSEYS